MPQRSRKTARGAEDGQRGRKMDCLFPPSVHFISESQDSDLLLPQLERNHSFSQFWALQLYPWPLSACFILAPFPTSPDSPKDGYSVPVALFWLLQPRLSLC